MPSPSQRIATLTGDGDDGWEIFYRARAMKAAGHAVLELTIGEHDIGTNPLILDEMHRAAKAGHTGYAAVPGVARLRAAVAARLSAQHGQSYTGDNVLIVPGGQAGLFAAHHAACDPGALALMIDPYYATYPRHDPGGGRTSCRCGRAQRGWVSTRSCRIGQGRPRCAVAFDQ